MYLTHYYYITIIKYVLQHNIIDVKIPLHTSRDLGEIKYGGVAFWGLKFAIENT